MAAVVVVANPVIRERKFADSALAPKDVSGVIRRHTQSQYVARTSKGRPPVLTMSRRRAGANSLSNCTTQLGGHDFLRCPVVEASKGPKPTAN